MKTIYTILQYAYLVIAAFLIYATITEYMNGGTRYILYALMAVAAIGMFFFKRYFNKKFRG